MYKIEFFYVLKLSISSSSVDTMYRLQDMQYVNSYAWGSVWNMHLKYIDIHICVISTTIRNPMRSPSFWCPPDIYPTIPMLKRSPKIYVIRLLLVSNSQNHNPLPIPPVRFIRYRTPHSLQAESYQMKHIFFLIPYATPTMTTFHVMVPSSPQTFSPKG